MSGPDFDNRSATFPLTTGGKTGRVLHTGDIIGEQYRLTGLIGRGGMGYVFRARHQVIDKEYALKMLMPDQVNEVTWSRFQDEGRAIARLDHPNIVKIFDMGVDRGDCPYYVMELMDGRALSECIQEGRTFTVDQIIHLFMQLAEGFGYAHKHGIIHRDVKPGNIMLVDLNQKYPTGKIVDFGIAKLTGKSDLQKQSQTATGEVFGSPYYMSPEQCLGGEIDQRSDIYSLGCTLFELLAGRPPFVGESAMQTVLMHQNKPSPTLESVSAKFSSDEMEALVAKMLAKRPADRYQTMEQVYHDLERIYQRKGVGRGVETGFKTSAQSQLEDMGERLEEEKKKRLPRALVISGALLIALLTVGSLTLAVKLTLDRRKLEKLEMASPGLVPTLAKVEAERHEEKSKHIEGLTKIVSRIDKKTGKRYFKFPEFNFGTLIWQLGKADDVGIDTNVIDDATVRARGLVTVPAAAPLILSIDSGKNQETWEHPEFLASIGPDEITGLSLNSNSILYEEDEQARTVLALLKAVSDWRKLQSIELYGFPVPNAVLSEIDKHSELKRFTIRNGEVDTRFLGGLKFLRSLKVIELANIGDADFTFRGMTGSTNLVEFYVNHTVMRGTNLKGLATCPRLASISLIQCRPDAAAIEAFASIGSLKALELKECQLKPEQIAALAKLRHIPDLRIDISGWSDANEGKLKLLMGRSKPCLFRRSGIPPSETQYQI